MIIFQKLSNGNLRASVNSELVGEVEMKNLKLEEAKKTAAQELLNKYYTKYDEKTPFLMK
jgi:hypothetical protein